MSVGCAGAGKTSGLENGRVVSGGSGVGVGDSAGAGVGVTGVSFGGGRGSVVKALTALQVL